MEKSVLTLSGRTAVITGGSQGIGYAIATAFAQSGMNVAILSVHNGTAKKAAKTLSEKGCSCVGFQCDVSDVESIRHALELVHTHFGNIDVIVNSAGILDAQSVETLSYESWSKVINVNLTGSFFVIQQALPYLEKSRYPRVINISSNAGRMGGYENGLAYSASKGGVIALTYGLARRLAPKGITVNCIAPGTIESNMSRCYDESVRNRLLSRFPIGRFGVPEDVAVAACFFASEESGFTTGAVLDVNGGLFMG